MIFIGIMTLRRGVYYQYYLWLLWREGISKLFTGNDIYRYWIHGEKDDEELWDQ